MILEPATAQDALRPLRQQNLVDAANDSLNTSTAGRAQTIATGRGRGIIVPDQPNAPLWDIVKRTTAISGQPGRFNGKLIDWLDANPHVTAGVAVADFGTFNVTNDDAILWEVSAADVLSLAIFIGIDRVSHKPIFAIPSAGLFPVKIENDGGSQGTSTTAATWTYKIKTLNADLIQSGVGLSRPRPLGTATVQGVNAYGVAFYAGGSIILWDAGEIYGANPCP